MVQNRSLILTAAFLILFGGSAFALDWDIINEDFSSISEWTNSSSSGGAISQVTFDGESCLKLDYPSNASADAAIASATRSDLLLPDTYTLEFRAYVYSDASGYGFYSYSKYASKSYDVRVGYRSSVQKSSVAVYTTTTVTGGAVTGPGTSYIGHWATYRMVVKSGRLVDVWVNGVPYVFDLEITAANSGTLLELFNVTNSGTNSIAYVDYVKIDTTPEGCNTSPFNISDEKIVVSYSNEGIAAGGSWLEFPSNNGPLMIEGKLLDGTYGICSIPLVATNNSQASKVRIFDGTSVVSLKKIPS